jgi:hypothetical protein
LIAIAIGLIIWWHQYQQSKKIEDINSRVKEIVEKAEFREDWRKHVHLFRIRSRVGRVERLVRRRARRIRRDIIDNPTTATLERCQDWRNELRTRELNARRVRRDASNKFDAIIDLIEDFDLAEDVDSDLGNVARLLAAIRNLDPINQPQDRERLTNLLQDLNTNALVRLREDLRRIRHEEPQIEQERQGRG